MSNAALAEQVLKTIYAEPDENVAQQKGFLSVTYGQGRVRVSFIGSRLVQVTFSSSVRRVWTFETGQAADVLSPLDLDELVRLVRELRYDLWGLYRM